jgi:CO/xanthine dehydrogenase FAD-binding subunit
LAQAASRRDFLTASTIEEALAMVNENPDARFIAGGTTLVRMERWGGNLPSTLIYIGQIEEMQQVREEGGRLVLGALVVHDRLRQAVAHRAGAVCSGRPLRRSPGRPYATSPR